MNWRSLRESFDHSLPRIRAINIRGGLSDLSMVSLCSCHQHGYAWQGTKRRLGHSYNPDLKFSFPTTFGGSPNPSEEIRDFPLFSKNLYGPDMIARSLDYPVLSLHVEERFFRTTEGDYSWETVWSRNAYRVDCPLRMEWMIEGEENFKWTYKKVGGGFGLSIRLKRKGELPLYVAIGGDVTIAPTLKKGGSPRVLILEFGMNFRLVDQSAIRFGLSTRSLRDAWDLINPKRVQHELGKLEKDWDRYFKSFPMPSVSIEKKLKNQLKGNASSKPASIYLDHQGKSQVQELLPPIDSQADLDASDTEFAYYKGLWHSRIGERIDPVLSHSLTETYTCYYNGTFAWSLPVAGFYAHVHPDKKWRTIIRNSMEGYRENQMENGWLPCYVQFDTKPNRKNQTSSSTQIPQYAWTVWQEYLFNRDKKWLASWYEPLCRYADCMKKRDESCLNLGLWCQTHYYDGLDMYPTVDGLVIRKDPFLYSAVYAAEQVRFLEVLSLMAGELNLKTNRVHAEDSQCAHARMIEKLWDEKKQWFGDLLANGKLETVIGMGGLFAAAYGQFPSDRNVAQVRKNLESLITPYGVATVAPADRRYTERFFWRGPVWPASCLYGAAAAHRYTPDLLPRMAAATIRFTKAQPNIWECLQPHSGQIAAYDEGVAVMPGVLLSVVGAYAICSTLRICAGEDIFSLKYVPTDR